MAETIFMAAGGTGGHIYIGLALARELLRRDPSFRILFVGTPRGLESQIVPREGFSLEMIRVSGLKRVGLRQALAGLLRLPGSLWSSIQLVRKYHPGAAVGLGGYASGPVILAASCWGAPALLVEPNAVPGMTNRWLAPFVDRVAVAFQETERFFGKKAVCTGVPVRQAFLDLPPKGRAGPFSVLIFGGSQGSHTLNVNVCEALKYLRLLQGEIRLSHQTGDQDYEWVRKSYRDWGVEGNIVPYIHDMAAAFGAADLIVSRAGASTIAEITAGGKAALLIPFAGAADSHQQRNAEMLARAGAARVVLEQDLCGKRLGEEIERLVQRREEVTRMEEASRSLARPDATLSIVDLVQGLMRKA
ncbi:MAG: undecaprenyldiphospho-muramoylpentapeptide beta-N-acetylglucosaminyltransferase [Acidobacteria bacterium]|nr:undecaprenyldiphospho-muramoylpentapeptide beta-N-acetylglucosaminyltransferase [Acidobacteriota bacterium]